MRQQLLKHSNSAIKAKAEELWPSGGAAAGRAEVLARYSAATTLIVDTIPTMRSLPVALLMTALWLTACTTQTRTPDQHEALNHVVHELKKA